MNDQSKTKPALIQELLSLRQRIAELEQSESERKKAEKELRENEERFKDLYDMAPVGCHEYDAEGRITRANQTVLDMLGYSREEIIGQYIWSINFEVISREQVLAKLAGKLPPGRQLERTYRRKDGTLIPVLIEDRVMTDERGAIRGIRCTVQDITESKRIEAETAALAEIGRVVGSTLNIDEVYEKFAAAARKLISFDRIHVNLNSPDGEYFTTTYVSGMEIAGRRPGDKVLLVGSISDSVIRTRAGLCFHPANEEELARRFPCSSAATTFRGGMNSIMAVPLLYRDEVIGTLHFRSKERNAYTERDLRVAEKIGAQIAGAIGSAKLFSDHRRAEEALRESEAKFRGIYEASPVGIELYDRVGTLLDINDACLQIFGISDGSLVKGFKLFADPNLSEELREQLRKGESVRYEMPFDFDKVNASNLYETTKSGIIYLDLLITPLVGVTKESDIGYLVHIRDITVRKQAEEHLKQSEAKYRSLIETALDGYVMTDMQGNILDCNKAYLDMLGYTMEEIKNLAYQDITPQKWHQMEEEIVKGPFMARDYSDAYEKEYIKKDGGVISISIRIHLIRDEQGMPLAMWGFTRDITKFKRAEEERRTLEERLQQAEKMEMVGTLAGGVAHDLNNLLGVMQGNAELLALGISKTDPLHEMVDGIMSSSQRAEQEVQDLLTLARRGVVLREPHNLNRITADLLQTSQVRKILSSRPQVTIKTQYDRDLWDIKASATHVERALANLIANALHAIPEQGTITARTENRSLEEPLIGYETVPKGKYAVLTVSDTGRGILPEYMPHLFEPFYMRKVHRQGGSGLGLSVIWGALKDNNGYIDVTSNLGQGTAFSLYFPAMPDSP